MHTARTTRTFLTIFTALLIVAVPMQAFAVGFGAKIWFWDTRSDRDNGSRLKKYGSGNNEAENIRIELWDRDGNCQDFNSSCSENDDDYLTDRITNSTGYIYYAPVPQSDPGGSGEADIYMVHQYESDEGQVFLTGSTPGFGVEVTVRSDTTFNVDSERSRSWNITCHAEHWDFTCDSQSQVDNDYSLEEGLANITVSMADVEEIFGTFDYNGPNGDISIFWPDGPSGECEDYGGLSMNRDQLCIKNGREDSAHLIAHELGHNIHKRLLDLDYSEPVTDGSCTSPYGWTSLEDEKCVVAEGWAWFVAGVTYWTENATDPWVNDEDYNIEGDTEQGNSNAEPCVVDPLDGTPWLYPEKRIGNATRFFWDLYDATTDGDGNDNANYSLSLINDGWDDFPSGTGNREASESGDSGRNARDYNYHFDGAAYSEMSDNCLTSQTND